MSKAERINRYEQLIEGLAASDLTDWRNTFLKDLENAPTFTKSKLTLPEKYQPTYPV